MTITELESLAHFCGMTLAELSVALQQQSATELLADAAARKLVAELKLVAVIPQPETAQDRYDRLTARGLKLNLITGRWER